MSGGYKTALLGVIAGKRRDIILSGFDTSRSGRGTTDFAVPDYTYSEANDRRIEVSGVGGQNWNSRGVGERSSGKIYYEIEILNAGNATLFGWFQTTTPNENVVISTGSNLLNAGMSAWYTNTVGGVVDIGGASESHGLSGIGVWQFAVDFSAGRLWIGRNNVWGGGGDPGAGTSPLCDGETFGAGAPGLSQNLGFGTNDARLLASSSEFVYAAPSGFIAYATE